MLEVRRQLDHLKIPSLMEEGEVSELVAQIVSITNVSEDDALFALNDNNFELTLALDELMKQLPDAKVQQKQSRRKKKEADEAPGDSHLKESGKKDGAKEGKLKTERSQNRQSNNRKERSDGRSNRNKTNNSSDPSNSQNSQVVQPLMEIQTGNWQETEARMMNGGDSSNFESGQDFSQRDRFQSRRGRSRGGTNRGDFKTNKGDNSDFQSNEDADDSNQFSQPFVVGTFDAKAVTSDGGSRQFDDRTRNFDRSSRGGRGGNRFGRGGRSGGGPGGRDRYNNRDRNHEHSNRYPNLDQLPTPMDNFWPAEEKWDVKSDGDWRGREFKNTKINDVPDPVSVLEASQQTSMQPPFFADGNSNSSAEFAAVPGANLSSNTTANLTNGDLNAMIQSTEKYGVSGFDQNVNSSLANNGQSENLLLKLFNQGANTTGQFDNVSAKTEDIVAASSQFASMSIGNPNSQSNLSSKATETISTDGPDVPPGFNETLDSEKLEFGQPPSSLQQSTYNKKQHSTNMPSAPVELPSPVAQFTIKTSVNFGEIDPNYMHKRTQFTNLPSQGLNSGKGGVHLPGQNNLDYYASGRYSSQMGGDVAYVASKHQTSLGSELQHYGSSTQGGGVSNRSESLSISAKGAPAGSISSQAANGASRLSSAYAPASSGVTNEQSKYGQRHQLTQQEQSVFYKLQHQQSQQPPQQVSHTDSNTAADQKSHQATANTNLYTTPTKHSVDSSKSNSYFASSAAAASQPNNAAYSSKIISSTGSTVPTSSASAAGGASQQQDDQLRYSNQNSNNIFGRSNVNTAYQTSGYGKSGQHTDDSTSATKLNSSSQIHASINSQVASFMSAAAAMSSNNSQSQMSGSSSGAPASTVSASGSSMSSRDVLQHLQQQHQLQQMAASPLGGITSPTGFQIGYVPGTTLDAAGQNAATAGLLHQHVSSAQQVRYSGLGANSSASHPYQVISNNVSVHPPNYNQFLNSGNTAMRPNSMDHGASNHSGQEAYSLGMSSNAAAKLSSGTTASRRMDDTSGQANNSPSMNVGSQNLAAQVASANPAMSQYFYHAQFAGGGQGAPYYSPTAAAVFNAPGFMPAPFGIAQFQALQQQQQNQQAGQTVSSMTGSNVAAAGSAPGQQASTQGKTQQQSGNAGGNLNSSSNNSQPQQTYSNGPTPYQGSSYFQTQQQQTSSDYMNSAAAAAGDYTKYAHQQQQNMGGQQQHQQNYAASRAAGGGAAASQGGMGKSAMYANTSSDYSSMYHTKGQVEKNSGAAAGMGIGPAGLASNSPPQGPANTGNPPAAAYSAFHLAATNYGQAANAAATQQQLYSQQYFNAAAAQSHMMQHHQSGDPRASGAAAFKMGGQVNLGAMGMPQKHPGGANSQHASAGGYATASGGAAGTAYRNHWQ